MSEKGGPGDSQLADEESDGSHVESWLRKVARVSDGAGLIPLPQVGQVIGDKYRIEEQLGKGGMGAVYRATHVVSDKQVALKWMLRPASDERARQRFTREARAAGRIDHPNVVDVYDIGQDGDASYLVMELLRGESLRGCLAREQLSPSAVVDLLLPAMRGVAAAHREGVIHRDLKPDNIFLCRAPDGEPREAKVLDFGISAVSTPEPDAKTTLTKEGTVLGTPAYMSPEQLDSVRNADARTDVYAFGVILYEALTGSMPFVGDRYSALVFAIATANPRPPREHNPAIPVDLERVVLKALEKDRDHRVQSMDALIAALQPFARAQGAGSGRPIAPGVQRGATPSAARGARRIAAVLVLLLALGAFAWWATQGRAPGPTASGAVLPTAVPVAAAAEPLPSRAATPPPPAASSASISPALPVVQQAVDAPAPDNAQPRAAGPHRTRPRRAPIAASDEPTPEPAATPAPKTTDRRTPNLSLEDF